MRLGSTGHYERRGLRRRDGAVGSQGEGGGSFLEAYGKEKVCAFLLRPGFRAEPNRVWCITARRCDVGPSVTVQVSNRETVDCSFAIAPGDLQKVRAGSIIEKYRADRLHVADDDVRLPVAIHVRDGHRVGHLPSASQHDRVAEFPVPTVEIDEKPLPLISHHDIDASVAVQIPRSRSASSRIRRADRRRLRKMSLAVVPENDTLTSVAMRHKQVNGTVAIEIRRDNDRRRFRPDQ